MLCLRVIPLNDPPQDREVPAVEPVGKEKPIPEARESPVSKWSELPNDLLSNVLDRLLRSCNGDSSDVKVGPRFFAGDSVMRDLRAFPA